MNSAESNASFSTISPATNPLDKIDKINQALRLVPEFDGNSNVLIRFLNICDQLVLAYVDPSAENQLNNYAVINGILNKVTGSAARTLATNGIPSDWNGIRSALINSFSDHRDESSLYSDLSMLSQGSDTPHVFYERIQNLLGIIMTYVALHDDVDTTVEAKRTLYKKLALQTYLKGLHEPLGSRVRCMRPPTLEKALEFAQEELNVIYLQNKNSYQKPPPQFFTPMKPFNTNPFLNPQSQQQSINRPKQYHPIMPQRPYQGPSRTQQMFRALPRSNMSTGFRIHPGQPQNQQQRQYMPPVRAQAQAHPMSGVSHPQARTLPPTPIRNDWDRPTNQYSTYREINTNEYYPQYDPNYELTDEEYYYVYEQGIEYQNPTNVADHLITNRFDPEIYPPHVTEQQMPEQEMISENENQNFPKILKSNIPG